MKVGVVDVDICWHIEPFKRELAWAVGKWLHYIIFNIVITSLQTT